VLRQGRGADAGTRQSAVRSTQSLNNFKRMGKFPAVVEYVASGSRFKYARPRSLRPPRG
jgi:hypothetical protein